MPSLDILTDNEKQQCLRPLSLHKKIQKAWSQVTLKRTLHKYFNIKNIEIIRPKNTKPFIKNGPFFNVSHSDNNLCIAISFENPIGLDIEKMNSQMHYQSIIKNFFSKADQKIIKTAHNPIETFFELWTQKESFIKLIGKSIMSPEFKNHLQFKNHICFIPLNIRNFRGNICIFNTNRLTKIKRTY